MGHPRKIIVNLGSGTPWGQSFWRKIAFGCARQGLLNRQQHELVRLGKREPARPSDIRLETGNVGHGFVETYLTITKKRRNFKLNECVFRPWEPSPAAVDVAWRTFQAFRLAYRPEVFGPIVGTEYLLPFPCKEVCLKAKRGQPRKRKCKLHLPDQEVQLANTFGLPYFTAAIDLITKVSTAADIRRYKKMFDVKVVKGLTMHDWKFVKSASRWTAEKYYNDIQPRIYERAWNACHPADRQIANVLFHLIEKLDNDNKEFLMYTIRIPTIRPVDLAQIELFGERAIFNWDPDPRILARNANIERCNDWNRPCEFQVDGSCPRC